MVCRRGYRSEFNFLGHTLHSHKSHVISLTCTLTHCQHNGNGELCVAHRRIRLEIESIINRFLFGRDTTAQTCGIVDVRGFQGGG